MNWVAYDTVELNDGQLYSRVAAERSFYGEFFRDLVGRADAVVTSTPEMSALVERYTLEGRRLTEGTYSRAAVAGAWEAVLASPGATGAHPTPCSGN